MSRILIIEDDQYLRDLYQELMETEGYKVDVAVDGEEGSKKALEGGYDLLVVDIMLPKKDGLDILRDLKAKKPAKPNGKIVLLTNLGQDAVIKEGFDLGASGYLIKSSMTPDQVLHEFRALMAKD
jgi:DNA-binding response OmpR family regulator